MFRNRLALLRTETFASLASAVLGELRASRFTRIWIVAALQVALLAGCNTIPDAGLPTEVPVLPAARIVPGRLIVKFKPGTSEGDKLRVLQTAQARGVSEIHELGVTIIELPEQASEIAEKRALEQQPQIEYVELDRVHAPAEITPNDFWYFGQWHLSRIGAPLAWATTTGSSNVIIAICDTGVDAAHPDLAPKLVPGWNVYNNSADTSDATGHGTAVAGIAAAAGNNTIGVASVAWGSRIMPIRIGSATGSTSSSIIASGIVWAADRGARVVNVSFGVQGSAVVSNAALYLGGRGGVVISSAGNEGLYFDLPNDRNILTVSATDASDLLAAFSNYGTFVDLSAPGAGIFSTVRGGSYAAATGTFFAAPSVAGAAALVLSANPNLNAQQVQEILIRSCDDLGATGWDTNYSWGRVNAGRAVAFASGTPELGVDSTPPTVSFTAPVAGAVVSGVVSVQVSAADNVEVSSVHLYANGSPIATDTTAPFDFAWSTSELSNGSHTLTARAQDAAGNATAQTISVVISNAGDLIAPGVTIIRPSAGSWIRRAVTVEVTTTDNVGVARVELFVDGVIHDTSTTNPFTTTWNGQSAVSGTHLIRCKAYDAAGNVGHSPAITVYR